MALIDLEDVVSVGVPEIDSQHGELVGLINALGAALQERRDDESVGRILSDLVSHTRAHFDAEEALMRDRAYPERARHDYSPSLSWSAFPDATCQNAPRDSLPF